MGGSLIVPDERKPPFSKDTHALDIVTEESYYNHLGNSTLEELPWGYRSDPSYEN